jgi:cation-transporting ATPase 13A3/4/5
MDGMDDTDQQPQAGHVPFYNLEANESSASIFEDVEMAQDEVC